MPSFWEIDELLHMLSISTSHSSCQRGINFCTYTQQLRILLSEMECAHEFIEQVATGRTLGESIIHPPKQAELRCIRSQLCAILVHLSHTPCKKASTKGSTLGA